jgi:hypothetical protein
MEKKIELKLKSHLAWAWILHVSLNHFQHQK